MVRAFTRSALVIALLLAAPGLRADGVAGADEAPLRPFWPSTLHAVGAFATAPLRAGWGDLAWALPAGALLGVSLANDVPLYHALASGDARKDWLDHSMPAVSALGDGLTEFGVVAILNAAGDARLARTSATAMQALLVSAVWAEGLKFAAWSNRPYIDDSAHRFFDYGQDSQGFPSGHSWSAFAVAEVYGAEYGRQWTYPFAALVAYSRVYNQDHWPSDVVAGAVLGIITGVQARRASAAGGAPGIHFGLAQDGSRSLVTMHAPF